MRQLLRSGLDRTSLLWYGVALVLFGGLLYLADVGAVIDSIRRADPGYFAAAVVVGISSLLVWAWVWHRFFGQLSIEASWPQTVQLFLSGHFLNSVTPLGQFGGEPVMAYLIAETTGDDYGRTLACVVSSDIVNAVPFFTFPLGGIVYLSLIGTVDGFLVEIGLVVLSVLALGAGGTYLLWFDNGRLHRGVNGVLDWLEARLDRGESVFESVRGSVREVAAAFEIAGNDPRFLLVTGSISHLAILAQIVSLYLVFLAMGIEPRVVPLYFIVTLSTIATLSPTPGGSGTYEAAFAGLLTLFYPVPLSTAVTAAVLFRLTTYWPGLLIGFGSFLTLETDVVGERA